MMSSVLRFPLFLYGGGVLVPCYYAPHTLLLLYDLVCVCGEGECVPLLCVKVDHTWSLFE